MSSTANLRDVARRAGVSIGTVSNVLNYPEKVASGTIERVRLAIDELGFVPNGAARQLRQGRSSSIGFVVLDVANPFFADIARSVEQRAEERGMSVLIANSGERADREASHLDLFERQRVDGLLVSPVGDDFGRLVALRARGIPAVLVDRLSGHPAFSSVSVDDLEGGRIAAEHLLAGGRRELLFVGGPLDLQQVRDRLDGAREAVSRVPGARIEVLPIGALTVRQGVEAGREIAALPRRPDAVMAANDLVALGILQSVALVGGMRVPDDVAIVGYDDIDFAASAVVPITSVRQPREQIGVEATNLLLDEIEGGVERRRIVFGPQLVARASSAS